MPMDELPVHLLAELPKITIAAHSYSKQAKTSFIFANDRMLHEAENLSPGLRLEHITPDSMIFSYKGYRFRRGLQP
jgi:general secretion pathway protein B